jgi:hypothetical protein
MTAYATVAAALAAFLAVRAAEQQEKATFTSQLYSKQVDVLANAETTIVNFIRQVFTYYRIDKDERVDEFKVVELAYDKASDALNAMRIVYPANTSQSIDDVQEELNHVYKEAGDAPRGGPSPHRKEVINRLGVRYQYIQECAASQLSGGINIDAKQFNECISMHPGEMTPPHQ